MIRAQAAEREREEREEGEMVSHMCRSHHHYHHHPLNSDDQDILDEEEMDEEDMMNEDEEDEDEDEDEEDMDFKMVLVVNRALELKPGALSMHVAKATVGLFRRINAQPQAVAVGPDELSMWEDLGERMITLSVDNDQHLSDLELMAKNLRLPCHLDNVVKEERLRKTVLALFGEEREVNKVTGRLKVMDK